MKKIPLAVLCFLCILFSSCFVEKPMPELKGLKTDFRKYSTIEKIMFYNNQEARALPDNALTELVGYNKYTGKREVFNIEGDTGLIYEPYHIKRLNENCLVMELWPVSNELTSKHAFIVIVDCENNTIYNLDNLCFGVDLYRNDVNIFPTDNGFVFQATSQNGLCVGYLDKEESVFYPLTNFRTDRVKNFYASKSRIIIADIWGGQSSIFKLFPNNGKAPIIIDDEDFIRCFDRQTLLGSSTTDCLYDLSSGLKFTITNSGIIKEKTNLILGDMVIHTPNNYLQYEGYGLRFSMQEPSMFSISDCKLKEFRIENENPVIYEYDIPEFLSDIDFSSALIAGGNIVFTTNNTAGGLYCYDYLNGESYMITDNVSSYFVSDVGVYYSKYETAIKSDEYFFSFATKSHSLMYRGKEIAGIQVVSFKI